MTHIRGENYSEGCSQHSHGASVGGVINAIVHAISGK